MLTASPWAPPRVPAIISPAGGGGLALDTAPLPVSLNPEAQLGPISPRPPTRALLRARGGAETLSPRSKGRPGPDRENWLLRAGRVEAWARRGGLELRLASRQPPQTMEESDGRASDCLASALCALTLSPPPAVSPAPGPRLPGPAAGSQYF